MERHFVVEHRLRPTIKARYVRIHPISWYGWISMRMELYGCRLGEWYTYNVSIGTSYNKHDTYKQYWSITNYSFSLSRQD